MSTIKENISCKNAVIGIIGLGYVGIPLSLRFCQTGFKVIGFDIDKDLVTQLNHGKSSISHISDSSIRAMIESGFEATYEFSKIKNCDALIICVPTPLDKDKNPDLSFVTSTMDQIQPFLKKDQILSLESTTWPGTTQEIILPYIEKKGFVVGKDFYLVYSPEREDPGNPNFSTQTIPKIVGGTTEECLDLGKNLYENVVDKVVPVSSTSVAEMIKLYENIHRSVNIGLVNEMKVISDKLGLDIYEIIDGAKTKPFGFTAYYPGPGVGGHCIPIDPFYLTWKIKEFGIDSRYIELSGEINNSMPNYIAGKIKEALNKSDKSISSAKILILGLTYKPDVDDCRESPSVHLMEILKKEGAFLDYSDPYFPEFPKMREHSFDLKSVDLSKSNLNKYDLVALLTDHSSFDYDCIKSNSKILVDTRGKYREDNDKNIIKA
tara:strand:- start:19981 stop:21285 length:1305 start_codon:yes stop_codon:yes gene_type:complete